MSPRPWPSPGPSRAADSSHCLRWTDISEDRLTTLVASGDLVRVRRGAYVSADTLRGASAEAAYAMRARAILHGRPTGEALSHHAALAVRGLPLHGVDLTRVDLMGQVTRTMLAGIARVRPLMDREVVLVGDARCVATAEAIVQVARASGVVAAAVSGDQAVRAGLCSEADVRAAAASRPSRVGSRRVAELLTMLDPASESVGETRTRILLRRSGLQVESQVPIADGHGEFVGRVDLLVEGRVVVEFDGALKYALDPAGRALFREKVREDRLRDLGYAVVRVTWADLSRPERLLARVYAALTRATA